MEYSNPSLSSEVLREAGPKIVAVESSVITIIYLLIHAFYYLIQRRRCLRDRGCCCSSPPKFSGCKKVFL